MNYIYNARNKLNSNNIFLSQNAADQAVGYIVINVITGLENKPLQNANVTIYVRTHDDKGIPIFSLVTTLSSILVQFPVIHSPGTVFGDPKNGFSIYDIIIQAEGYYTTRILNVRMYPDVRTNFNISMIPIAKDNPMPNLETIIEPPSKH